MDALIDLSHSIEDGLITYEGLPGPTICDYLSRSESRSYYANGTEFQIGKIEMVANTGTYVDAPFHRYAEGADLSELALSSLANLPALVVRAPFENGRVVDIDHFQGLPVSGRAVLVHTGWSIHWKRGEYFRGHPYLTRAAADYLKDKGAILVGIDSLNIDDTDDKSRPVHSILLGGDIPIVEHLTGLDILPNEGFYFSAVPVKVKEFGSFPVRAYARLVSN
jgi:kynurenine formamidase